jgi:hypothetical protein
LSICNLSILNSVLSILKQTGAASKGSMGKLMGDKAELVILKMVDGTLAASNSPGYDLIGKSFLPEMLSNSELKYEVKLRRLSVTTCNFEKSKIDKFDIGIVIWYDEETLLPALAFAIHHEVVKEFCSNERAHITAKVCKERGVEFTELLKKFW